MPGGQRFDNHSTYTRTSPGSGLVGDWKSTALAKVPPNTLTIRTSSNDDVTLTLSAIKATVNGKWDGRPYPVRSPIAPKGATAALSKIGTDGFKLKHYVGAMIVEVDQFTLVSDGRSMVEDGTNGKGRELFVNVWDRRLTVSPAFAQVQTSNDAIFGTWKLDVANSKLAGSPIKGDTLTIEPTANGFRLTQQSEFATGKLPAHVTVCNFDGRPCPTEADNSISTRRVNGYEIRTEMLHAGKQVGHQTTRVSKDRRTMTVDSWEQGAAGKPIHRVLVFQRQQQAGAP